jgi:hypothetical protein
MQGTLESGLFSAVHHAAEMAPCKPTISHSHMKVCFLSGCAGALCRMWPMVSRFRTLLGDVANDEQVQLVQRCC